MRGINLIPAGRRAAQQRRRRLRRWTAATLTWGGMLVWACIAAHFWTDQGSAVSAADLSQAQQHVGQLNTQMTELRKKFAQALIARQTAEALSDQPDWSLLLAILGDTVGDELVLRDISLKPAADSGETAADPRAFELQLRGFAPSQPGVSQFVLRLQQLGLFDEVKLLRTGREPILEKSAVTFEITCTIRDGARSQPLP